MSRSEDSRLRVTLELDTRAEPIAGHLDDGAGHRREFAGWLELTTVLSRAMAESTARPPAGVDDRD